MITHETTTATVDEIIELINQLNTANPHKSLSLANRHIFQYKEDLEQLHKKQRLQDIVKILTNVSKDYPDFKFSNTLDGDINVLSFGDKYKFIYRSVDDYNDLIELLAYLTKDYPYLKSISLLNDSSVKPEPEQTLRLSFGDSQSFTVKSTQPDEETYVQQDQVVDNEQVYIDTEEVEAAKKNNIERLRLVKREMDDKVVAFKNSKIAKRLEPISVYVESTKVSVAELIVDIESWLSTVTNDDDITVLEFAQLISEKSGVKDLSLIRVVTEVVKINMSQELKQIATFKETSKPLYIMMNSQDKEMLLAVALLNLNMVRKQKQYRDYDDIHLVLHVLEYANKNSSLTVAETPEEITELAKVLYDVLLSKNLESEFVYAADVNNHYDAYNDTWFTENNVVQSYMKQIAKMCEGDKQDDIVNLITITMGNRDKTMSSPRLDTANVNSLFNLLLNLPIKNKDVSLRTGYFNNTYVVGGYYPTYINDEQIYNKAFIIATSDCIAVMVNVSEDSYFQEFFNQENTSKLIKWLEYFIPTQEGDL